MTALERNSLIQQLYSKADETIPDNPYKKARQRGYREAFETVLSARIVEAEPVKHGRWLIGVGENGEPIGTYCSECGWSWERNVAAIQLNKVLSRIETPRCPNCGAKMDEGVEA